MPLLQPNVIVGEEVRPTLCFPIAASSLHALPFASRSDEISLTPKHKKRSIRHQKSTASFLEMAAANGKEALIFLHVPKSAGTTLNRLIEREYPLFEMYSVDPVLSQWSRARLWRIPQRRLKRFRVFKDHMPFWAARDPPATSYLYHRDARGCGTGYLWLLLYEQLQVAPQLLEIQTRRLDTGGSRAAFAKRKRANQNDRGR